MHRWRISHKGRWTEIGDIGSAYDGVVLTREAYLAVESAYASLADRFVTEAGNPPLFAREIEFPTNDRPERGPASEGVADDPREGDAIARDQVAGLVRAFLRGRIQGRLASADGATHIAFGYLYAMFLAAAKPCPDALAFAESKGLQVESVPPE
jgi:hypothetical protein